MGNPRTYGSSPFRMAVVHGGPGAGGEMAPVARELANRRGVLEPIQTSSTLDGQIEELRQILEEHAASPVTLIGYSWGAWLSCFVAAAHPAIVEKLILVSSGPFEERYAAEGAIRRLSRLDPRERDEFAALLRRIEAGPDRDAALARLGELASKADSFDPIEWETRDADAVPCDGRIFQGVWPEAAELRRSGALLELAKRIRCRVLAIHGDHDPYPAEGVEKPLSLAIGRFRFHLLDECGHIPWLEKRARAAFFAALERELASA